MTENTIKQLKSLNTFKILINSDSYRQVFQYEGADFTCLFLYVCAFIHIHTVVSCDYTANDNEHISIPE